jgi:hypothetical protein
LDSLAIDQASVHAGAEDFEKLAHVVSMAPGPERPDAAKGDDLSQMLGILAGERSDQTFSRVLAGAMP